MELWWVEKFGFAQNPNCLISCFWIAFAIVFSWVVSCMVSDLICCAITVACCWWMHFGCHCCFCLLGFGFLRQFCVYHCFIPIVCMVTLNSLGEFSLFGLFVVPICFSWRCHWVWFVWIGPSVTCFLLSLGG